MMEKTRTYLFGMLAMFSLVVLIFPSMMYLFGKFTLEQVQWIMLIATVMWFASAALWMGKSGKPS